MSQVSFYLQHDRTERVAAVTYERIDGSPSNGAGGSPGLAPGCPIAKMDQIIADSKLSGGAFYAREMEHN